MKFKLILILLYIFYAQHVVAEEAAPSSQLLRVTGPRYLGEIIAHVADYYSAKMVTAWLQSDIKDRDAGFLQLCSTNSTEERDVLVTNFKINQKMIYFCGQNKDIQNIYELSAGYYALLLVGHKDSFDENFHFTKRDIYSAIAGKLFNFNGVQINKTENWSQINDNFPNRVIKIFGPRELSSNFTFFQDHFLLGECLSHKYIGENAKTIGEPEAFCLGLRDDGKLIGDEPESELFLQSTPESLGFVKYSIFMKFKSRLQAYSLDGILPTEENIRSLRYGLTQPIYVYIKITERNKALTALFLKEAKSPNILGEGGYLLNYGLVNDTPEKIKNNLREVDLRGI